MSSPATKRPGALSWRELAAWAWRQLTSMRIALLLLFLLAIAAIPGSVIPQDDVEPLVARDFRERHPDLSQWYERLGLFDVYSSPWFAAIYLALLVSLVGCILPRVRQHWRALRAAPPRVPSNLSRMPTHQTFETDTSVEEVLAAAHSQLRRRRLRVVPHSHDGAVSAEGGYLREVGNLLFHLGVVVVLVAVGVGGLFGYRANVVVTEGSGFTNQVTQFDSLSAGQLFDQSGLPPFQIDLESFEMEFVEAGPTIGTAENFAATVRFVPKPGAQPREETIRVNEPLSVDGSMVHILNPGYAPVFTVRSSDGTVLSKSSTPFLPQDNNFASTGVVKVEVPPEVGEDIGIEAGFFPTAVLDEQGPRSVFPGARNPAVFLTAYHGDLGLDDGVPQSVYRLEKDALTQFTDGGEPFRAALSVGDAIDLPDGAGSVTFDGYVTWVNFQVSRNAGKEVILIAAVAAAVGLMGSLYIRRRRIWVRAARENGRTTVEIAGLSRTTDPKLETELAGIAHQLQIR